MEQWLQHPRKGKPCEKAKDGQARTASKGLASRASSIPRARDAMSREAPWSPRAFSACWTICAGGGTAYASHGSFVLQPLFHCMAQNGMPDPKARCLWLFDRLRCTV